MKNSALILLLIAFILVIGGCTTQGTSTVLSPSNYKKEVEMREKEETNIKDEILKYVKLNMSASQNIKIENFINDENGIFATIKYSYGGDNQFASLYGNMKNKKLNIEKFEEKMISSSAVDLLILKGKLAGTPRLYTIFSGVVNDVNIHMIKVVTNDNQENMITINPENLSFMWPLVGDCSIKEFTTHDKDGKLISNLIP